MQPTAENMLEARQLGDIGSLTGIIKGIMTPSNGLSTGTGTPVSPAPANAVSSFMSQYQDCYDAVQEIEEALNTSERYMKASESGPTIKDIEAVLAVLSNSLEQQCQGGNVTGECSDCKLRLYIIVNGLQNILAMVSEDEETMASSTVGSVMTMTTVSTTAATTIGSPVTTTMTMTMTSVSTFMTAM